MNYETAVEAIVEWAMKTDNVRAVVLTGSAAEDSQHPLSDRDIELHVHDAALLEGDDSWWEQLGTVLAVERLENDEDEPTRLIHYVGGKLDFTLVGTTNQPRLYDRAYRVLLDKDKAAVTFRKVEHVPDLPTQATFDQCCNWAAAAALMVARSLVRDEPWSVSIRDSDLKAELLRIIEWDHNQRYGRERDVRYLGTRMRSWMDPRIQAALPQCWGTFGDSNPAPLLATLELFAQLASRVALRGDLTDFDHLAIRAEVENIMRLNL